MLLLLPRPLGANETSTTTVGKWVAMSALLPAERKEKQKKTA